MQKCTKNGEDYHTNMQRMSVESSPLLPSFTIAFVNCHSGGRQGTDLIALLNKLWVKGTGIVVDLCSQQEHPHTNHDGELELVAMSGPCQFACGRCGCCEFHKLGQASGVKIELRTTFCLSADGEGWCEVVEDGRVAHIEVSRQGVMNTVLAEK